MQSMTLICMILYEIKNRLHFSAQSLIMTIMAVVIVLGGVPLIEGAVMEGQKNSRFSVAFVDEENSAYTGMVVEQVVKSPSIKQGFELIATDRERALAMLKNNEIAAAIIVPEGFIEGMKTGHQRDCEVILNPNQVLYANLVAGGMESGSYIMSAVQNALYTFYEYTYDLAVLPEDADKMFTVEMFALVSQAMNRDEMYNREIKTPWQDMEMADFYSISVLLLFMTLYSAGGISQWHEKNKNGLVGRMQLTCKHPIYVAYANIIADAAMIFIQGVLIFIPLFVFRHGLAMLKLLPVIGLISLNIAIVTMLFAVVIKNTVVAIVTFIGGGVLSGLAAGNLIPFYFLPDFIPKHLKSWTLNYYWQQLMINVNSSDWLTWLKDVAIILGVIGLILLVLRGIISEKNRNYKNIMA